MTEKPDMDVRAGLRQEGPERRNNAANEIRHIVDRFERWFRIDDPRSAERYIEGEAPILVHFMLKGLEKKFVAYLQGKQFVSGDHKHRADGIREVSK